MNIIFHASAGTGKTYQVTNLYVALVLGRPYEAKDADGKAVRLHEPEGAPVDPRRVLLMTFTDNAAAELRTRVTQLVLKARYEACPAPSGAGADTILRTVEVLRALPSAPICTIHSFCAGFLREHALEAGLSPGFAVLDEADAGLLLDEVARAELLARLNKPEPGAESESAYDPHFEAFCIGEQRVLGGGEYTTAVSDAARTLFRQAASKGIDLKNAEALLPPAVHTVAREDFEEVLEGLKRVRAERGGKLPEGAAVVFQRLEKCLHDFPMVGKSPHPNPLPQGEREEKKQRGTIPSSPLGGEDRGEGVIEQLVDALAADGKVTFTGKGMKELSDRLKELVGKVQNVARYRNQHAEIRAFARYAAAVAESFERRKDQLNVVDFDGLLIRTRDMLRRSGTASPAFDYLIVDEVQDTSRVQCEIIESLWDPKKNRLVICGDTKQSIYAWRNADPKVMPDLEEEIGGTKESRRVPLKASYRSKDSIIDLVNLLFARVYGEEYGDDDRLVPAREKAAFVRGKKEKPCVELLEADWEAQRSASFATATEAKEVSRLRADATAGQGGQRSEIRGQKSEDDKTDEEQIPQIEERVRMEMTALAQRIRLLVSGPKAWQPAFRYADDTETFAKTGKENAFRYSDVLVLLRRTTNQQVLEHVLRQYDIPYRIGGRGKGLFARPEVKDALLFLKTLTHPFDTISLIGFLRSPWIGLSDEAIIQLGWSGGQFSEDLFRRRVLSGGTEEELAGSLAGGAEAAEQAARVVRARELITEFSAQTGCRLASDLLRDLIQQTGYDAVIAGTFRGGQHLANLRKLIDWLRQAERGGTVLLADVVKKLQENADAPPDIPEAALLDPEENAVTIMTVHGAKGLTARVVFVPELSVQPPGDTSWALLDTPDHTAKSAVLHVKTEDLVRQETATPGFAEATERAADIRKAESRNVFYVAMTRARDLVVLSGPTGGRKASGWREQIDILLADDEQARSLVRTAAYGDVTRAFEAVRGAHQAMPRDLRPPEPALFDAVTRAFPRPLDVAVVLRFPATTLSAFHADPEEYLRTKISGAEPPWMKTRRRPEEAEPAGEDAPPPSDTDESGFYAAFGTAGHTVLEQLALDGWRGDVRARAEAAAMANGLDAAAAKDLRTRLEQAVGQLTELTRGAKELRAEWPFALSLKKDGVTLIVDGTMDLVFQTLKKKWHIVDYKFTDEPPSKLLQKYSLQLNLYREALTLAGINQALITATLIAIGGKAGRSIEVPPDPACADTIVAAAVALHRAVRT